MHPPGSRHPPGAATPLGVGTPGRGTPQEQAPLARSPSTSPLAVGLDQIPLNFPLGCGPGNLQGMLEYHPPRPAARHAGIPSARHAGYHSPRGQTDTCKNLTFAFVADGQYVSLLNEVYMYLVREFLDNVYNFGDTVRTGLLVRGHLIFTSRPPRFVFYGPRLAIWVQAMLC